MKVAPGQGNLFAPEVLPPALDVFRPVQYLGSKLRALAPIVDAVDRLLPGGGRVLDAFTGSTVVAQALAQRGHQVLATDAMEFSAVFARALLGVGRTTEPGAEHLLERARPRCASFAVARVFTALADVELDALRRRDADQLLRMTRAIPQVFDHRNTTSAMLDVFQDLRAREGQSALGVGGLVTTHYAGTYFGIGQAIAIDEIRLRVEELAAGSVVTAWERDVLLTALLSAASDCAFTPGKHFALPHCLSDAKDPAFFRERVLLDRSIDVEETFRERVRAIHQHAAAGGRHIAGVARVEDLALDPSRVRRCGVVYADPPYTAQQYSRFYHVLEVIVRYTVPVLQTHGGVVTRGLYPEGRYLSPFCSKRGAPGAFEALIGLARGAGAALVVSYSATATGQTGNDRMISLDRLTEMLRAAGTVRVIELDHAYRQFNSAGAAVDGRGDREYLIISSP